MDWPLTGALTGVGVLACVVGFGAFTLIQSAPEPVKRVAPTTVLWAPGGQTATLIVLDPEPDIASYEPPPPERPRVPDPAPRKEKKNPPALKPPADDYAKGQPLPDQKKSGPANAPPAAKTPAPKAVAEQWRVVTTAKASFSNLGGHVDKNGVVDNMANSHLREAFQKHRNFGKLPSNIKTHINTQNINLALIAPYRGLLGINDKAIEEQQGIRFEKVVARSL